MSESQELAVEMENAAEKETTKKPRKKAAKEAAPELVKMYMGDKFADVHPDMVDAWKEEGWRLA